MPWRLIGFIILFAVFLAFIVLNLGNSSDISFGFVKFQDVPVYLTVFTSFIAGLLCAIPVIVSFKLQRKGKQDGGEAAPKPKKKGKGEIPLEELTEGENGPYGIG
jgi:uncharacterized integral membrane protein